MIMSPPCHIVLVGDSDISRWPPELFPSPSTNAAFSVVRNGLSGAVFDETISLVSETLRDAIACTATKTAATEKNAPSTSRIIVVICAGENDIGQGYSIDKIIRSFERVVDECFGFEVPVSRMIYLGPKIEPWLTHDPSSRKQYVKLSKSLQRAIERHNRKADIHYIDCLLMFCGESANIPGAVTAKAKAEERYFHNDGLHLSDEGYSIWKQVIEDEVNKILLATDTV